MNPHYTEGRPPACPAPASARRVTVTLRFSAKDPAVFTAFLRLILPDTRAADGLLSLETHQGTQQPGEFLLYEIWDSIEQQQSYLGWRQSAATSTPSSAI